MTRLKGATAFLLALIWLQAPAVGVSGEPRKGHRPKEPIAVLLDLEGAQASLGRPAMNGFVLGLQHATEDEPTLFTALVDTKTDAKITEANAKTLARSVSMAAGFTDNDSVLIGGPYFQRARVPFLSIGATDPALPEEVGESVFLTPFGDNTQAAAAAEFARRELGSTVAILWDATSNYTRALPRYFRTRFEELGGFVLLDASFDGGCDLSQLGNQVVGLASSPVFIYLAGLPDCIGEVVASLRAAGVAQPILGGDGFDTPNLLEVDSGATTNVWFTTHAWLSEETGSPEAQAFIAAYRDAFGASPPNAFAALGYDAARLVLDALRRARSPRRIFNALERTDGFRGVTGTISFSPDNHVPLKTVWILQVQAGVTGLAAAFVPDSVPPPLAENP